MNANGPAIKGVSVAERVQAGAVKPNRGNVPAPAGRSEAWRGFCHPVASFFEFYECRGTRFIESRSPVTLHRLG